MSGRTDWRVVVRDGYAALFDTAGDWAYLYSVYHRNRGGDGGDDADAVGYVLGAKLDYELMIHVALAFCVLSTMLTVWTVFTSLGRVCGRNSACCNCTVSRLALASIVLEDIPQFLLTVCIDYSFGGELTPAGMLNICSSLTAFVNRATARYNEMQVEDGDDDGTSKLELVTPYEAML